MAETGLEARSAGTEPGAGPRAGLNRITGHIIVYRHADPRFPFLWESADQPPGRWHGPGEGPVQYFADTPNGAWAEFLRHEGITEVSDLVNVRRALWAVELPRDLLDNAAAPQLDEKVLTGGSATYAECQKEARTLRARGASGLQAPSAALLPGGASGWTVDGGIKIGRKRDGIVLTLFGRQPGLTGWMAAFAARPPAGLLARIRHL